MSTAERIGYVEQTCEFEEYLLKPMNCPHHIQIYAAEPRSYRDLPRAAGRVRHGLSLRAVGRALAA